MELKEWTPLLSNIATFISMLIIFFTLIEMRNQRRSAYKPDIVLAKNNFFIYWEKEDKRPHLFLNKDFDEQKIKEESFSKNRSRDVTLDLFNLGMGAGKFIEISWEYSIEDFLEKIRNYNYKNFCELSFLTNKKEMLVIEKEKTKEVFNLNVGDVHLDYLLPSNVKNECKKISLPSCYLRLSSILFYLTIRKDLTTLKEIKLPDLKATINYEDIGGKKHKKNINIKLDITEFALKEKNKLQSIGLNVIIERS